jgi:hypothetical protein
LGGCSGYAAFNRRDFKLMLVRYAPDVEIELEHSLHTLGLGGTYHGHAGWVEGFGRLFEVWDPLEAEPAYVLDLGDRVLCLGLVRAHARASEVQLEEKLAQLTRWGDNGLVTREQSFFSWEEGLRAAGLDLNAITLPSREKAGEAERSAG